MPRKWTPEQKAAQAEKIKNWKPWEKSTGPKTRGGKRRARMNALTHGFHTPEHKVLRQALKLQREFTRGVAYWAAAQESLAHKRRKDTPHA